MTPRPPRPGRKKSQSQQGGKKSETPGDDSASKKRRWSRKRGDARRSSRSKSPQGKESEQLLIRPPKRIVTPFRLLILGMVLLVAVTSLVKMKSSRRDRAERELKTAVGRAEVALGEGDFVTSAEEYRKASAALDVLKRSDAQAESIRQRFRETTAAGNLITSSLLEILDDLQKQTAKASPRGETSLDLSYGRRWIVIETTVEKVSVADGSSRMLIDCPLGIDGKLVQMDANLPLFEKLSLGRERKKVIFAAELQGYRLTGRKPQVWTITFRPETAFLWTDYKIYQAIGLASDEADRENEIRKLLAQQSVFMGIEQYAVKSNE